MMSKTREQLQVDKCADVVRQARATLEQWETTARTAADDLEQLQRRMGEQVLETPERAEEFTREMQSLRDRIAVAESAIAAQRPKVAPAEQAYLLAEADLLESRDLVPAKAALADHQARTEELLALLEEHEGRYVPEADLQRATHNFGERLRFVAPRSAPLRAAVFNAECQVQVVRELAAGRDPGPMLNQWNELVHQVDYPACVWGADALVPARAYLQKVEHAHRELAELEGDEVRGDLLGRIESMRRQAALEPHLNFSDAITGCETRLAELPIEAAKRREEFAELTRVDASPEPLEQPA
jgi:hypothetical protein